MKLRLYRFPPTFPASAVPVICFEDDSALCCCVDASFVTPKLRERSWAGTLEFELKNSRIRGMALVLSIFNIVHLTTGKPAREMLFCWWFILLLRRPSFPCYKIHIAIGSWICFALRMKKKTSCPNHELLLWPHNFYTIQKHRLFQERLNHHVACGKWPWVCASFRDMQSSAFLQYRRWFCFLGKRSNSELIHIDVVVSPPPKQPQRGAFVPRFFCFSLKKRKKCLKVFCGDPPTWLDTSCSPGTSWRKLAEKPYKSVMKWQKHSGFTCWRASLSFPRHAKMVLMPSQKQKFDEAWLWFSVKKIIGSGKALL